MNPNCKFITPHVCVCVQLFKRPICLPCLLCLAPIWLCLALPYCDSIPQDPRPMCNLIPMGRLNPKRKEKRKSTYLTKKVPTSTTKFEGNKMLVYLICKPHSLSCLSPPTPPHNLPISFRITFSAFFPGYFFKKLYIVSFVFGKS
jgi:hypothetical protein